MEGRATDVVLPSGELALLGTAVYGVGGYHPDRGRIESVAGIERADLAFSCTEDPYDEVAIFDLGRHVEAQDWQSQRRGQTALT